MKLQNLQVLRAFASIAVVVFHAQGMATKYTGSETSLEAALGGIGGHGVDLFFVISGFIMRYAQPVRGYMWRSFLVARLERIVPLYWLLTGAMLLIWYTIPQLFADVMPEWARSVRSLLFVSFSAGELPVVYVGWSLEYEMFFYLVIVTALLVRQDPWKLVMTTLPLMVLVGVMAPLPELSRSTSWIFQFLTDPLMLEFTFGVWLADRLVSGRFDNWATVFVCIAMVSVLLKEPGNRSLTIGIPATILLWIFIWLEIHRGVILGSWLQRLGDASYSIYLIQVFALSAIAKLLSGPLQNKPDTFVIVAAALTTVIGLACYVLIEAPVFRLVRKKKKKEKSLKSTV